MSAAKSPLRGQLSRNARQRLEHTRACPGLAFEGKPPQPKKQKTGLVTLRSGDDGKLEAKDNSATGEPKLWLTDAARTKYTDWSSFWEKDSGIVAFEVPEGATDLTFHDGDEHAWPIKAEVGQSYN